MTTEKYTIGGMHCAACSARVERVTAQLPGVNNANVNLLTNTLSITFDEKRCKQRHIITAIERAGFTAERATNTTSTMLTEHAARFSKSRVALTIGAAAFVLYLAMFKKLFPSCPTPLFADSTRMPFINAILQCTFAIFVLITAKELLVSGAKGLWRRCPNMDSLVLLGAASSFLYSAAVMILMIARETPTAMPLYFESAAMVPALVMTGKMLEERCSKRTSAAIKKLASLAPDTAVLIVNGVETVVPIENIKPGDVVLVKPGSVIPVDGTVCDGVSSVDESLLTGESVPIVKQHNDAVTGGSMNVDGTLTIVTTQTGEGTTLSKIVALMTDAQNKKAPVAKIADRISYYFVPTVLGIAVVAAVVWFCLGYPPSFVVTIGVSVLVIACPCSLGLATPAAVMAAAGAGAGKGILFKSGEAIENAGRVTAVVFDKTGTLTEGRPEVTHISCAPNFAGSPRDILQIAASIERYSKHPFAAAVCAAAETQNVPLLAVHDFTELPGRGVTAIVDGGTQSAGATLCAGGTLSTGAMLCTGATLSAGNAAFMQGVCASGDITENFAKTNDEAMVMYVAVNGSVVGALYAADKLKASAPAVVKALRSNGVKVYLLTGDHDKAAHSVAARAGIDDENVISQVLPQDKEAVIARLQEHHTVMMAGDGINDAPALARADCGVALGTGSDIARESGNVVLLSGDITVVPAVVTLGKAALRTIRQNLFWAFCYNTLGIPIAAGVLYPFTGMLLNPMIAGLAMSCSSICVVLNALRLTRR